MALAVCDALALAVARDLHDRPDEVFKKFHPGGAIGATKRAEEATTLEVNMTGTEVGDLRLEDVDQLLRASQEEDF